MSPSVAAVILAGGRSTRMGGDDKAFVHLVGRPMILHVVERLRSQAGQIAINSNRGSQDFAALQVPVIGDRNDDRPGPLAGILAGVEWAQLNGYSSIVTVPADTPFIPENLVQLLSEHQTGDQAIVLASSNGRLHPTVGLWSCALAVDLANFIATDPKRRVMDFADRHAAISVEFPLGDRTGRRMFDPFFNVNTPDDLREAHALFAEIAG